MFGWITSRHKAAAKRPQVSEAASDHPIVAVPVLAKPKRLRLSPQDVSPKLDEYAVLCQELGYFPSDLEIEILRPTVERFLVAKDIPVYSYEAVCAYLEKLCDEKNRELAKPPFGFYQPRWIYLRQSDALAHKQRPYTKPVPVNILHRVKTIRDAFPKAVFRVSELSFDPDPFLAVNFGALHYVVGVWDEPGFDAVDNLAPFIPE